MAQDGNPRRVSLVFPIILIAVGALFTLPQLAPRVRSRAYSLDLLAAHSRLYWRGKDMG